ncbi:MAG TPA: antibiotic biosynthesis monooxygenase [Terriglobales bacterium]|nr:antibiotic biosynthesis monooxygenase [Terriglobales bacterium]
MFTRVVEVSTKTGKSREVCSIIRDKILPILRNQTGFMDEITLVSNNNPDRVLALSLWKTKEDAQRYDNQQFQNVTNLIRGHLESEPTVETYDLESSTVHKIAAGKAA